MDSPPLLPSGELCTHCTAAADVVGYLNVGPGPTNGYCTRTDAHTAAGGIAAGVLVREPLCDPLGVIKPGDTAPPATDSQ